jgi:glycogen debranching enzyme
LLAATSDRALAIELEPNWRAAGDWIARTLDRGDGLLRHTPGAFAGGLTQQGWRDARDPTAPRGCGILRPDGTAPQPPLADADTQAVTMSALRALASLSGEDRWRARADALRSRLSADFGPEVLALEAGDRPVPGAGSHLGWLVWSDALQPAAARAAIDRLCDPDILTHHGLRTLAASAPTFDAYAYHRGSVWAFDSWLGWCGLRAAGLESHAEQVRAGVLTALAQLHLAPELYAVTTAGDVEPIPVANRIQAWTVGARWALEHRWNGRHL